MDLPTIDPDDLLSGDAQNYSTPDPSKLKIPKAPKAKVRRQLPPKLRPLLSQSPGDDRSAQFYHFACELNEAGVKPTLALAALVHHPPGLEKYDGRIEAMAVAVWVKAKESGGSGKGRVARAKKPHKKRKEVPEDRVEVDFMTEDPLPIDWLWDGLIPLGTYSVLAGIQGTGKSTLAVWLAGQLSRGKLPGRFEGEPQTSLIISSEEDRRRTIIPRLMAVKADRKRVGIPKLVQGGQRVPISLPEDMKALSVAVEKTGAKLLIIDPLNSLLGRENHFDSHNDVSVRRALTPIMEMAEELELAVLGLMHHRKSGGTNPLFQVLGSQGFTGAPRSVLNFYVDPDVEEERTNRRILTHDKASVSAHAPSQLWQILPYNFTYRGRVIKTSRVEYMKDDWRESVQILEGQARVKVDKTMETVLFIKEELKKGDQLRKDLIARARDELEVSKSTFERAIRNVDPDSYLADDNISVIYRGIVK